MRVSDRFLWCSLVVFQSWRTFRIVRSCNNLFVLHKGFMTYQGHRLLFMMKIPCVSTNFLRSRHGVLNWSWSWHSTYINVSLWIVTTIPTRIEVVGCFVIQRFDTAKCLTLQSARNVYPRGIVAGELVWITMVRNQQEQISMAPHRGLVWSVGWS